MNLIALNGSGYSIARWLPGIPCPDELHWTYAKALELAEEIKQPTTLIGFSRGATMAIVAALHCKHVQKVYCHSPSFRIRVQKRKFDMEVFCTTGDRTPTEWGAKMTHGNSVLN